MISRRSTPGQIEKLEPFIDAYWGATDELSLRVSVAALVRVVFKDPESGDRMLALERKATFLTDENRVKVSAQPFGGAMRINDTRQLLAVSGGFHFDSPRSRTERDFRIVIRPSAWQKVRDFCLEQFQIKDNNELETTPDRELEEEFEQALGYGIQPEQYDLRLLWTLVENEPAPTRNFYAQGQETVRIYRVFEALIVDTILLQTIRGNSEKYSVEVLHERALEDLHKRGRGWANAFLILPEKSLREFYLSLPPEKLNSAVTFEGMDLEGSVPALLEGVEVPRFQRI